LENGHAFQLSYQQINEPVHSHGDHHVSVELSGKEHRRFMRAINNQKGFRFSPDEIKGGGLFDIIKESRIKSNSSKYRQTSSKSWIKLCKSK
jgi:hypothetical protein